MSVQVVNAQRMSVTGETNSEIGVQVANEQRMSVQVVNEQRK
jgi:hypothetical protein